MKRYLLVIFLGLFMVSDMGTYAEAASDKNLPKIGSVKINAHPANLRGKTVVLRWNGKMNGDKFLTRFGELLTQQVKNVRVVKMWEVDKSTAAVSKSLEDSVAVAQKIAAQKPTLVIASQADCGGCTAWLVVDQLNLEKLRIPTVTITTTAFADIAKDVAKDQGVGDMSFVVVEHPIAGWNLEDVRKKMDGVFPEVMRAATKWQPAVR